MTTPEITPVGGPKDTFTSVAHKDGIILKQLRSVTHPDMAGADVIKLTPDDAYGLLHRLLTELRSFDFPEMIVRESVGGPADPVPVMECPRCGYVTASGDDEDDTVDIIDFDIRRSGFVFHGDVRNPELHGYYDSETNYELLIVECANCHDPVSLPKNVTEHC